MASPRYLTAYQELHRQGLFPGRSIKLSRNDIRLLVKRHQAETLLDYGCGDGRQYSEKQIHKEWGGIRPTLYDPAAKHHAKKPRGTFDGVICTDVLEHIPEDELDDVLREIFAYAKKFVLFSVSTVPSKKKFPDGTNLHVTLKPRDWWHARIAQFATCDVTINFRE